MLESTMITIGALGVHWRPQSRAAAKHNICKALDALKIKPAMPLQNLWKEWDVLEGRKGVARSILHEMYKAFQGQKEIIKHRTGFRNP